MTSHALVVTSQASQMSVDWVDHTRGVVAAIIGRGTLWCRRLESMRGVYWRLGTWGCGAAGVKGWESRGLRWDAIISARNYVGGGLSICKTCPGLRVIGQCVSICPYWVLCTMKSWHVTCGLCCDKSWNPIWEFAVCSTLFGITRTDLSFHLIPNMPYRVRVIQRFLFNTIEQYLKINIQIQKRVIGFSLVGGAGFTRDAGRTQEFMVYIVKPYV